MQSLSTHGTTPIFPLRISIPTRRRIEEAAKKLGLSAAAFIRQAAEARLQQITENDNDLTRIGDKPNLPAEAASGAQASVGEGCQSTRDEHGGVHSGSCLGQGI